MMKEKIIMDLMSKSYVDVNEFNNRFRPDIFAELIIQECIETIQMKIPREGKTPENLRSYQHVQDIRAKFGIEE